MMTKTAMASSPRNPVAVARRLAGGSIEVGNDHLVIRLPAPRLLRLVARSVLLAALVFSIPWLRDAFLPSAPAAGVLIPAATQPPPAQPRWVDDPLVLPMLIADLKRQGLLSSNGAGRAVFLGDPGFWVAFLRRHGVEPVPEGRAPEVADRSVDFVLVADGSAGASLGFVDRVLRVGGVTAVRLSSDPSHAFRLPANYRTVYIRRFGSTFVATKKIGPGRAVDEGGEEAAADSVPAAGTARLRRLLSVPETKKEALDGLEDALLEPPLEHGSKKLWKRTRYLPELIGGSLQEYPRRVFVDVVTGGGAGSLRWFQAHYPTRNSDFELITVREKKGRRGAGAAAGGMSEWLRRNVREEQYVVMKAEAEVVEEMVKGKAIGLVDELFLECKNQWQRGKRSNRAYWECVALYGKLKDQGVAVHQWWG